MSRCQPGKQKRIAACLRALSSRSFRHQDSVFSTLWFKVITPTTTMTTNLTEQWRGRCLLCQLGSWENDTWRDLYSVCMREGVAPKVYTDAPWHTHTHTQFFLYPPPPSGLQFVLNRSFIRWSISDMSHLSRHALLALEWPSRAKKLLKRIAEDSWACRSISSHPLRIVVRTQRNTTRRSSNRRDEERKLI